MPRNLNKRVTTALLTLALLTSAISPISAADWYLEDGDITVSANESGQTVTQGDTTEEDDDPVIQNRDPDTATENTITIDTEDGAAANITIEDVNISSEDSAFDVGDADAVIQVEGDNTLTSTEESAIHVSSGSVTIEGTGSLEVTSTEDAAIGADEGETMSGDITIQGDVDVDAFGSEDSAVIGAEEHMTGSIEILENADVTTGVVDEDGTVLEDEIGYIGAGSESDHTHDEGSFNVGPDATVNGVSGTETEELLTYINAYVNEEDEAENLECCEHSYSASVTEPTCRYSGYTTYTCDLCWDSYTDDYTDPVDHDYSIWTSYGEDSHRHLQTCKYCGRGNGVVEDCDLIYVQFDDIGYQICAVCGTFGDETLELVDDAECSMGKTKLTDDAVIIRELEEPFGSTYTDVDGYTDREWIIDHMFTVTMKNEDGSLEDPDEEMTVTMKYNKRGYGWGKFKLVQLLDDGTWMEVEYTHKGNELTFTTEEAGLFLIVY